MNNKLAKQNFDYCKETAHLKQKAEISVIALGGRLHKIFTNELYKPNYESFREYLDDLKISLATASKLISIHQKFIIEFKLTAKYLAEVGGWSSVSEVVNLATTKKEAEEWLHKVSVLNRSDLRKEIKEKKTGVIMAKCKHKNTTEITMICCEDCGDKFRKYDK